jgi:ssDNA-binding Zn-finger/Zn-ribbon topoisomerase 1
MIRAGCPYCYYDLPISEDQWGDTVKCPRCAHFFDTDTPQQGRPQPAPYGPPVVLGPAGFPSALDTHLTAPHECHHCTRPVERPTGLRRSTQICPHCRAKTSIYTLIYWCPTCPTLLETPERLAGQQVTCPACGKGSPVPADLAFRQGHGPRDDARFTFEAPCCSERLEALKSSAGGRAVCPACLHAFVVPRYGDALRGPHRDAQGPGEVLQRWGTSHCPTCHLLIPARTGQCPFCVSKRR